MLNAQTFPNFETASKAVLTVLQQRIGLDLWMVTRTEGKDWIILSAQDMGYGVKPGAVFRWADTFCARMVNNEGPRVAPEVSSIPAYANALIDSDLLDREVRVGAYIGVPLVCNQTLFGTLCAVHPEPQSEAITAELPLIELQARLLSSLLQAYLEADKQTRCAERAQAEAWGDALTDLYNRRGWDKLLACEEERCQQFGHPACVLSIDLDGLKQVNDNQGHAQGDEFIVKASQAIKHGVRQQDIVARVGGDEFAVLAVECDLTVGQDLVERIEESLEKVSVSASVGLATRHPARGLIQAWETADQAMYDRKRQRKAQASQST